MFAASRAAIVSMADAGAACFGANTWDDVATAETIFYNRRASRSSPMRSTLPLLMLLGSAMLPFAAAVLGQGSNSSDSYLALVGATIYANPTDPPIRNGVVL